MNQIRALLFIFLAGCVVLGTTGCASDPEWIRPREGTYQGPSKAAADRPPGTCQQHNAEGVLVTIPCSELRTVIRSGVVGADASAAPAAPKAAPCAQTMPPFTKTSRAGVSSHPSVPPGTVISCRQCRHRPSLPAYLS